MQATTRAAQVKPDEFAPDGGTHVAPAIEFIDVYKSFAGNQVRGSASRSASNTSWG
jgi:hypothetical protein